VSIDNPVSREEAASADAGSDLRNGLGYGAYYYADYRGMPYEYNDYWTQFFGTIAQRIVTDLVPSSVLDAGCAIGMLVEALRERGVDAWGIDVSDWALEHLAPGAVGHCRLASIADPIEDRYDLITCIEVIEHISEPDASRAISNLCSATDRILLSSAPFDYAEPTHVNVRSPEDWAAAFAAHGFVRNLNFDASFVTPWAALYERTDATLPELVRSYERKLFRLNREVLDVRTTVLDLQGRLEELLADDPGRLERDRQQIDARLELLACRDALMGLEGELGEALGQAEELRGELERYRFAAGELARFQQSPVWRAYGPYARIRGSFGRRLRAFRARLG
jgi:SAM-dependent methyltransferase